MQTQWKAFIGALICAVLWGSAFPAIKTVYSLWDSQGVEISVWVKFWFAGLRFVVAGLVLLLLSEKPRTQMKATPLYLMASLTFTQTVLQYVFFYIALTYVSGSLGALLTSSGSFLWLLLAPLFGQSVRGGKKAWAILALGAFGVGLAVYSPSDTSASPILGITLLLLANLCGVLAILIFGKVKKTMGSRAATGYSLFFGGVILCIFGVPASSQTYTLFTPVVAGMTLYLAFVSAIAFALWYELSTRYSVSLLATFRFMIPVMGVVLSIIFLEGETFTPFIIIGAIIVGWAMLLSQKNQRKS